MSPTYGLYALYNKSWTLIRTQTYIHAYIHHEAYEGEGFSLLLLKNGATLTPTYSLRLGGYLHLLYRCKCSLPLSRSRPQISHRLPWNTLRKFLHVCCISAWHIVGRLNTTFMSWDINVLGYKLPPGDRLYIPASNSPENFFQLGKTLMCKLSSILSLFYTWGGWTPTTLLSTSVGRFWDLGGLGYNIAFLGFLDQRICEFYWNCLPK
jgi:hypothetical protein